MSVQVIPSACPLDAHLCSPAPSQSDATFPVEDLFFKYGVDLAFFGHIHDYEHFWPVYDRKVYKRGDGDVGHHLNPQATVHITTGTNCMPQASAHQSASYMIVSWWHMTPSPLGCCHLWASSHTACNAIGREKALGFWDTRALRCQHPCKLALAWVSHPHAMQMLTI